ncbi:bifunctional DNA-formamidopyrimidine glycosylase/DNA-(apurinic or apyrimidinic site) lyase [Corynebacterium sp. A21]|uniref:bifunctional DNA-formamidopyrimidine glycosylase/DNA-(apurinic or apyrimidinic site) lyase n=1 Tax=Corynebacterium sp. A21 TaxID=3457318 RepID=UPI003FD21A48
MPELPEVEVVRRGLAAHLLGAEFTTTEVLHPRANRGQEGSLPELLQGAVVTEVGRRGKYLWLNLGNGSTDGHSESALFVHLGMSGQMLVGQPGTVTSPHLRIRAELRAANGENLELSFVDQRTFGRWLHTDTTPEGVPEPAAHVAKDPLEPDFDLAGTARKIRTKNSEIKRVLLDQRVVSGIGNIYADESLWAAGVKPTRRASSLRQQDVVSLLEESRAVMERALAAGGTSFDSLYVNVNGASGYFARSLNVYGQEGEPCPRCGTPIRRVMWTNRSTHFCPVCQIL